MIADRPQLAFRVAEMFALPYADGELAGIVAFYAIVHLRELAAPFANSPPEPRQGDTSPGRQPNRFVSGTQLASSGIARPRP